MLLDFFMITNDKKEIAKYIKKFIRRRVPKEIRRNLSKEFYKKIEENIETPPPDIKYDYSYPIYELANINSSNPIQIAQELEKFLVSEDILFDVKAIGAYINFRVNPSKTLSSIFKYRENYGKYRLLKRIEKFKSKYKSRRIVIEYPSPNTNKPLHLGHIRNLLIGQSYSNLLSYYNNKVYQVNLNNDRGIHICKSMVAYDKWGNNRVPDKKTDHFVGDFYIKYNEMVKKDPSLENEAKKYLNLWENGDEQIRKTWIKLRDWSLKGFSETYKMFNIKFDKEYYESIIYEEGKELVLKGLKKDFFERNNDGSVFFRFYEEKRKKLPDKVVLRSDGTSIYVTQDIALAYFKKKDYNYNRSIYVVGNEQNLYFKQLFTILKKMWPKHKGYHHLSYGMISLPEGKMKSREGKVVDADDFVEEMIHLAYKEVDKRYPILLSEEKKKRAKIIGMAALRFFILKYNPKSNFIYNPKESISFEGETGPYIQYCYARIESIINKSNEKIDLNLNFRILNHEKELTLIKQLNYFPETIDTAVKSYGIHLIPQYLLSLCQDFNSFYSSCQVISENRDLERARLLLIKCVQIVIKIGLTLLGIETLEEM